MEKTEKEIQALERWQYKVLPYTIKIIGYLTAFFFLASFIQLYYLHQRIEKSPDLNFDTVIELLNPEDANLTNDDKLNYARWETLALLERHALQRRYHQANVLLMARVWTSYLGFVTGMILALVGAMFILSKIQEAESKVEAETQGLKGSLVSGSPGIILAVLGTALMILTIITHYEIEVNDGPLFTSSWNEKTLNVIPAPVEMQSDSISEKINEIFK